MIPWIEGEEDKIETEIPKILGRLAGEAIEMHPVRIGAQASRVPVLHGHTEMVSLELGERVSTEQLAETLREFSGAAQALRLPSAPSKPIVVHEEHDRPQPRLDVESGGGMMVHAGRLRKCSVLDHKSVILGHNVIPGERGQPIFERGASGGEIPLCTGANGTMTRRTLLQSLNEIYREGGLRTSQLVLAPGPVTQIVERVENGAFGVAHKDVHQEPARLCSSRRPQRGEMREGHTRPCARSPVHRVLVVFGLVTNRFRGITMRSLSCFAQK